MRALNFCMLLPGPEAQQLATYIGWRLHGTLGGIVAGSLIMVTQYAGFLAAWNLPGGLDPLTAGIIGALVTTYVTFLPCFFFIFAGAPFIEAMAGHQRLQAALTGVTAAVVGVVLNLAVWFGHRVMLLNGSPDLFAVASAVISLVLLQKFHFPIHYLVSVGAVAGVVWKLFR